MQRALERCFRVRGHDAVRGARQGFPKIRLALPVGTEQTQHVAPRLHRIVEAAKPHVDRADDFPATGVLGVGFEMRFDLRDQRFIERSSTGASCRAAWGWPGSRGEPNAK